MTENEKHITSLRTELEELRIRLNETEETLHAIRNGQVDAIIVSGDEGDKIFSLTSSETPYRIIIEQMDEGALTVSSKGIILYCNNRFAEIVEAAREKIVGSELTEFIREEDRPEVKRLLKKGRTKQAVGEAGIASVNKTIRLSLVPLPVHMEGDICITVSDVTEINNYQNFLREMVEERTSELKTANMKLAEDLENLQKAKTALLRSEQLFRSAFDEGAIPMAITSRTGNFLRVNHAFCSLTGFSEQELKHLSFQEITYPEDLEMSLKGRDELERGERSSFRQEKRYIRKDGRPVWVSISTAPVLDEEGRWENFVTHVQDINKRKVAESRLKESKEKFRQLANSIPQLAWIARPDGHIYWFNQRCYAYTGRKPNEMVGSGWHDVLLPEQREDFVSKWKSFISEGKPFEMVSSILGKDGKYREFLTRGIPMTNTSGRIDQWFGTHTDISELKKVEAELMNSREKLKLALENGQIGLWEWNIESNEVIWDERSEKMFGLKPGTYDKTFAALQNLINEEDIPHIMSAYSHALQKEEHFESIFRTRPIDGQSNYISSKAIITRDANGKPVSMSGVLFDVTDMKKGAEKALIKLNEDLLRSNTDLQQFAYVASHDLQEPLRMVSSFTQLLQQRYRDKLGEDGNEYIRYAVEGSKRMYELLNGLLTYSRIQTKGREFRRVDMNIVVAKVMENLNLVISERKALINYPVLPVIFADENQMIQLVQNLFENSIKFSGENPEIDVDWHLERDNYIFTVHDKGIGIEPQYYERIFRIFQRLHRLDEYGGTGIGLAICKRIVERHGGNIWVTSEKGNGSTFYFSIPANFQKTPF